jgi:hypothetical protein
MYATIWYSNLVKGGNDILDLKIHCSYKIEESTHKSCIYSQIMLNQSGHHQYLKILGKLWEALATNSMIILSKDLQIKKKPKNNLLNF